MKYKLTGCLALTLLAVSGVACSSKNSASSIYDKGISQLDAGNYREAAGFLEQAVEKDENNSEYSVYYGMALIKTGEYDKAVQIFDQAIKEGSKKKVQQFNKEAYRGKGIAFYNQKKYQDAIECFESALAIDVLEDLNEDIMEYLGECYIAQKQYDQAVSVYTDLLKKNKKCYRYYINKAKAQAGKEEIQESNDTLQAALKLKAKSDEDQYDVALVHYYLDDKDKAQSILNKIKDSYPDANAVLGDIYLEKKEYDQAIDSYEAYLSKKMSNDSSYISLKLSDCLIAKKDYKKAIAVIEDALGGQTIAYKQQLMYNEILAYEYDSEFEQAYALAKDYMKEYPKDMEMARELVFLQTR